MLPAALRLLPSLVVLCACLATHAADVPPTPAKDAAKPAPATSAEPVLVLPKIEVTQTRLRQIDIELIKIDKQIAREKKNVKSTETDKALNNEKVTKVAAIFGGNSAKHLSDVAATRVELLEAERSILEAMKLPANRLEMEAMTKEVEELRTARRNLDKVRR
jgi:hypothetical protein